MMSDPLGHVREQVNGVQEGLWEGLVHAAGGAPEQLALEVVEHRADLLVRSWLAERRLALSEQQYDRLYRVLAWWARNCHDDSGPHRELTRGDSGRHVEARSPSGVQDCNMSEVPRDRDGTSSDCLANTVSSVAVSPRDARHTRGSPRAVPHLPLAELNREREHFRQRRADRLASPPRPDVPVNGVLSMSVDPPSSGHNPPPSARPVGMRPAARGMVLYTPRDPGMFGSGLGQGGAAFGPYSNCGLSTCRSSVWPGAASPIEDSSGFAGSAHLGVSGRTPRRVGGRPGGRTWAQSTVDQQADVGTTILSGARLSACGSCSEGNTGSPPPSRTGSTSRPSGRSWASGASWMERMAPQGGALLSTTPVEFTNLSHVQQQEQHGRRALFEWYSIAHARSCWHFARSHGTLGLGLKPGSDDTPRVDHVEVGGPAHRAGLRCGDTIQWVARSGEVQPRATVRNIPDFYKEVQGILPTGHQLLVGFRRRPRSPPPGPPDSFARRHSRPSTPNRGDDIFQWRLDTFHAAAAVAVMGAAVVTAAVDAWLTTREALLETMPELSFPPRETRPVPSRRVPRIPRWAFAVPRAAWSLHSFGLPTERWQHLNCEALHAALLSGWPAEGRLDEEQLMRQKLNSTQWEHWSKTLGRRIGCPEFASVEGARRSFLRADSRKHGYVSLAEFTRLGVVELLSSALDEACAAHESAHIAPPQRSSCLMHSPLPPPYPPREAPREAQREAPREASREAPAVPLPPQHPLPDGAVLVELCRASCPQLGGEPWGLDVTEDELRLRPPMRLTPAGRALEILPEDPRDYVVTHVGGVPVRSREEVMARLPRDERNDRWTLQLQHRPRPVTPRSIRGASPPPAPPLPPPVSRRQPLPLEELDLPPPRRKLLKAELTRTHAGGFGLNVSQDLVLMSVVPRSPADQARSDNGYELSEVVGRVRLVAIGGERIPADSAQTKIRDLLQKESAAARLRFEPCGTANGLKPFSLTVVRPLERWGMALDKERKLTGIDPGSPAARGLQAAVQESGVGQIELVDADGKLVLSKGCLELVEVDGKQVQTCQELDKALAGRTRVTLRFNWQEPQSAVGSAEQGAAGKADAPLRAPAAAEAAPVRPAAAEQRAAGAAPAAAPPCPVKAAAATALRQQRPPSPQASADSRGSGPLLNDMRILHDPHARQRLPVGGLVKVREDISMPAFGWGGVRPGAVGLLCSIEGKTCAVNFGDDGPQDWRASVDDIVPVGAGTASPGDGHLGGGHGHPVV